MDIKVAVYSLMPSVFRQGLTKSYIAMRKARERRFAELNPALPSGLDAGKTMGEDDLKVVYVTGFPRSGTTVLKYFFGTAEGFVQTPFDPSGFQKAWLQAQDSSGEVLVDKSNHYVYSADNIFRACGRRAAMVSVVRDPRDCIVSFLRYHENREVPRGMKFWDYWTEMHEKFFSFAEQSDCGDRIIVVRYEDLVTHPEAAKAYFLSSLGRDFSSDELDSSYVNQNPGEGWDDSVHDHVRISTFALSKWRQLKDPSPELRRLLDAWRDHPAAARLMARLGYTEEGFEELQMRPSNFHFFSPNRSET
jgi:hypothetical protein